MRTPGGNIDWLPKAPDGWWYGRCSITGQWRTAEANHAAIYDLEDIVHFRRTVSNFSSDFRSGF